MGSRNSLYDRADSFGWISIALHWTTAVAIIALWFIGKSISSQPPGEIDVRRGLHIAIGLACWLPLLARIIWRFRIAHPRAVGQSMRIHHVARFIHFTMLVLLMVMLISGPLMAWAITDKPELFENVYRVHALSANILFALVVLHVLGTLKHLMFHEDETIARMIWPRPNTITSNKQQDP